MNINLIRLRNVLDTRKDDIINENDNFINEINNNLFDEDLILIENAHDAPFSIVLIETGGVEKSFLDLFDQLDEPIVLLSNGKNNSLAAALEIKTYANLHHKLTFNVTGDENYCSTVIARLTRVISTKIAVKDSYLGVIGEPSDWLIASLVDYQEIKDIFGINLIDISMDELFLEIDKEELEKIPHYESLKRKFKNHDVLNGALYIYSALKRLVKKYHLSGLTIRCFDLLKRYQNTACLALGLLNEEGIVSSCEGDIPCLITMFLVSTLTSRPCFQANPSYIKCEDNSILFAHCTLPINMASKYELLTHFESDLGVAIKGQLPLGVVTVIKIFINQKHNLDNSIVLSGNIKENCSYQGYCRTQINVGFQEYELISFLKEDFANHVVITYGDIANDIYNLISIYNLKLVK